MQSFLNEPFLVGGATAAAATAVTTTSNTREEQEMDTSSRDGALHLGAGTTPASRPPAPPPGLVGGHPRLEWARRESEDRARHRTDYEILDEIGSGGFGVVYKVRHRLDGQLYALKSVPLSSKLASTTVMSAVNADTDGDSNNNNDSFQRMLREVQVLSSINHPNVVRYYGAWVEPSWLPPSKSQSMASSSWGTEERESASLRLCSSGSFSSVEDDNQLRRQRQQQGPECHLCKQSYVDWEVSFEYWGLIDAALQPVNLCVECYKDSLPDDVARDSIPIREQPVRRPLHLFILMEYCNGGSLQDVAVAAPATNLSNGNNERDCHRMRDVVLWEYFRQCCVGMAHLHSKGIVHRDVKPSNVFVVSLTDVGDGAYLYDGSTGARSRTSIAKIGDLGLARTTPNHIDSPHDSTKQRRIAAASSSTSEVGTYLYMAPELKGKTRNDESVSDNISAVSSSADVYSLGVLLVEIFSSFDTAMERAKVLSCLAEDGPQLPQDFVSTYPCVEPLVRRMLSQDPKRRPTCQQILVELESMLPEKGNPDTSSQLHPNQNFEQTYPHHNSSPALTPTSASNKEDAAVSTLTASCRRCPEMEAQISELRRQLQAKEQEIMRLQQQLLEVRAPISIRPERSATESE